MKLYTKGYNYYDGYILPISVTDELLALGREEASEYCKMIYIKTGTAHFLLNGKEFILTGACAICMNNADSITFYDVNEETIKILWFQPTVINFKFTYDLLNSPNQLLTLTESQDLYFLKQFTNETPTSSKILSLHTVDSAGLEFKLQIIDELLTKQDTGSWPCRSRSYLLEILFCLARQEDESILRPIQCDGGSKLAKEVIYYLQSSYNKKITIEKLADVFHTNRTTLFNDFKSYTGQSVNQYLIELRITMASAMLRDTQLSVDEICERTGFSDISYFSKVFKKKISFTPSEYRRMVNHELKY